MRRIFLVTLLGGLAGFSQPGGTTVLRTAEALIELPPIRLTRDQRAELEAVACREYPAERLEIVGTYGVREDHSLSAFVRCHGARGEEGILRVEDMSCSKDGHAAWQCRHHATGFRIDAGRHYIVASNPPMIIAVPGAPPDNSDEALAAILRSAPRRLQGKYCGSPRYRDGVFDVECDSVRYSVARTCDARGCHREVWRR